MLLAFYHAGEVEGVTEEAAEGADKPRDDGEEGAPMVEPVVHEEAEPLIIESEMPERGTPEKQGDCVMWKYCKRDADGTALSYQV